MAELSGNPPFYNRKYDSSLTLDICNGLRPEFGEGTPEIYKTLAYRCMNANSNQRPKADELKRALLFWYHSIYGEIFGYEGKEIQAIFEEANKEIPNISISHEKDPDTIYNSQLFTYNNLPKPVNSTITTMYFKKNVNNEGKQLNYESCSYCYKPFNQELWCYECDPHYMIEGWTSENSSIDKFIKDTMYEARKNEAFLEWVPFDKFTDVKQIGRGGFSEVYSATWIDGKLNYSNYFGKWKKLDSKPMKVALKRLNGSQNMSTEYLNKIKTYWNVYLEKLDFYGITKDPETKEIMIIVEYADAGNLRSILSSSFNNILWKDKIQLLLNLAFDLKSLHKKGCFHKNFHSGNILQISDEEGDYSYISDFGLSGPANEEQSDDKIYGVLPYIAPEILNRKPYNSSSDIYSFGIVMAELSLEKPPFYDKKHDLNLALSICNGLKPEFGKETPNIYKRLAYKCMNADPNQRPTADKLYNILGLWYDSFNYKVRKIKAIFDEADKVIPNISTLYQKDPDAIYISRAFTFNNLLKPINSSSITFYSEENVDYGSCSYCNKPFTEELWCIKCDPYCLIEEWTSGNPDIDKFIKDTIYDAKDDDNTKFLEWVPFDKFIDIEQIGEGGFSKVYSAIWIDSKVNYYKPMKVALKSLNGSQNITIEYLNELKTHWRFCLENIGSLKFYGITKNPDTKEFMMILQFANQGNLRNILSNSFNNILWKNKIQLLWNLTMDFKNLHNLGYLHKDFHSGNNADDDDILAYISDFGLSGPASEQKLEVKIHGVLPYIAPEVLNGEPYTFYSDIYSFGVVMAELSSGKPPFHDRKHDLRLALNICNGLRPEFGKGTPEIYKRLSYKCMNANPDQRPTFIELHDILFFWFCSIDSNQENELLGYKKNEIEVLFEEADKEIPNISNSYEKDPDAIYTSRAFTFGDLPKPVNSSIITSYLNYEDSQLVDLDVKRCW